jgi:hypothetical protein
MLRRLSYLVIGILAVSFCLSGMGFYLYQSGRYNGYMERRTEEVQRNVELRQQYLKKRKIRI